MFITTSRKPVMHSRRLAKALCLFFPNCFYANRGKEPFSGLCERAYSKGQPLISIIHEKHGSPSKISLVKVVPTRDGLDFDYIPESFMIRQIRFTPLLTSLSNRAKKLKVSFDGDYAGAVLELFGIDPESIEDIDATKSQYKVECTKNRLRFFSGGALCMEIEYYVSITNFSEPGNPESGNFNPDAPENDRC